jgi:hypothetical protein
VVRRRRIADAAQNARAVTKVISVPVLAVTFGTAGRGQWRASFHPMEAIATITTYAAIACVFALIGIIWRHAERMDEAVNLQRRRSND